MFKYVAPSLEKEAFTCPYCNTLAQQAKELVTFLYNEDKYRYYGFKTKNPHNNIEICVTTCQACKKYHVWCNNEMLVPSISNIPLPLDGMPDDIKQLYNEARNVF